MREEQAGGAKAPSPVDRGQALAADGRRRGWVWLRETVLDFFFPRVCLVTGEAVEPDSPYRFFSHAGARGLYRVEPPACSTCGFPFFGVLAGPRSCPHCQELEPVFGEGRTCLLMRAAGRQLVHVLKYRNGRYLRPDIVAIARHCPGFSEFLAGAVLVPVPLHRNKARRRGYNQSRLIARAWADALPGCQLLDALERVRNTPSQTRLSREKREANVRGAFALQSGVTLTARTRYVLVDDVFTTGATLNACARVLRGAGARAIDVATLGHG
ncbi:MAG: ComF family protein [Opitutales bacterium]